MTERFPVIAKKEKDNYNYERKRADNFSSTTEIKAQELIDDSIKTLKNNNRKIIQTEIDKKINKDLSNLTIAIFNLTKDLKIKNSKSTYDDSIANADNTDDNGTNSTNITND